MTEHEQLTRLCEQLGAPAPQAATMAAQLLKRADQLVVERGISRETALKGLLDVVVKGRAGEVPPQFGAPPPKPAAGDSA
jgi:hypothetical protein